MHICVCEFHTVFKRIKLQNYYHLDKLEALVSPGCMHGKQFLPPSAAMGPSPHLHEVRNLP